MTIASPALRRSTLAATTAAAVLSLAALAQSAANAPDATRIAALSVCFPENDAPRSERGVGGFDVDVAKYLARQLDRRLRIVWLPEEAQTDIESTDADYRPLLMGQCDLQLSVPGTEAVKRYRGWLVLSEPYYGAGFELIPADSPFRFGSPFTGTVAVRANTVAHLALNAAEVDWSQQRSSGGIVRAVDDGNADAGLVWGPDLALLDSGHSTVFEAPPVLRWNLHAALRKDSPIIAEIDRILGSAELQAYVRARLAQHGIPVRSPFERVHTSANLAAL